jgi:hypothetical protein
MGSGKVENRQMLMQLRVLDLGFFQEGNVGVGVFRERKKLVCTLGVCRVACERGQRPGR